MLAGSLCGKVFGLVNGHEGTKVFRSEAHELRQGFGVQGNGACPFIPCISLSKHDSFLILKA